MENFAYEIIINTTGIFFGDHFSVMKHADTICLHVMFLILQLYFVSTNSSFVTTHLPY